MGELNAKPGNTILKMISDSSYLGRNQVTNKHKGKYAINAPNTIMDTIEIKRE